jgi:phosphonopyruvate decarboxylase
VAANEGAAVGHAIGHYLVSSKPALVYMQNAGLGNALNPLVSLADKSVYQIPMILLIGWRGETLEDGRQLTDEPQHRTQGAITFDLIRFLDIPCEIIDKDTDIESCINKQVRLSIKRKGPVALLARKNSFAELKIPPSIKTQATLQRESALRILLDSMPSDYAYIATTGMLGRELYDYREARQQDHSSDFLCVGGMGHAIAIATGIARSENSKKILCLDGDGALLMHMGSLVSSASCRNLVHVVFNNHAHDSVGGQPTQADALDLCGLARSCGYAYASSAISYEEIERSLEEISRLEPNAAFLEIVIAPGARSNLPRPADLPKEYSLKFRRWLQNP